MTGVGSESPIGISACLLGERTRYDGAVLEPPAIVAEAQAAGVRFVSVCPECESGLGVPRVRIALTGTGAEVLAGTARAIDEDGRDVTDALLAGVRACVAALARAGASEVWLKGRSPSCGIVDAPVGPERGEGVFAAACREAGLAVRPGDDGPGGR